MSKQMASSPATNALLSFTVRNVRSYWEEATLSLVGTGMSDADAVRELTVAGSPAPVNVLPVAGIFGANASGKSMILRAMDDMRLVVLNSFRRADQETGIRRHPFLLHRRGAERPSSFSIDLILEGVRWQYGFEINDLQVLDEYAYYYPRGRQALVFRRKPDDGDPSFGPAFRSSGRALARLVRKNALFLSVAGAAAGAADERPGIVALIGPLFDWFRKNLLLMESANLEARITYTAKRLEASGDEESIGALLQAADLGISKHLVPIDPRHESKGTLAWIGMLGLLLDAMRSGSALLVDELDGSLHPHLVHQVIRLFQNRGAGSGCAQLVFNAHDATILGDDSRKFLGRDQIWLTEKNEDGATTLCSMADYRSSKQEALAKRYLQGRYGGVPVLNPAAFEQALDVNES